MHKSPAFGEHRLSTFAVGNSVPNGSSEGMPPLKGLPGSPQQNADQRWQNIARTLDPKNASVRIVERTIAMEGSIKTILNIRREMGQITLDINRIDRDQSLPPDEKRTQLEGLTRKLQNAQDRLDRESYVLGSAWLLNLEGKTIDLPEGGTAVLKNFSQTGDVINADAEYEAPNGTQTRRISFSRAAATGIGRSMTDNMSTIPPADIERASAHVPLFQSPQDVGLPRMVYNQLLGR